MDSSASSIEQCCEVCRSGRFDEGIFEKITCKNCKRFVHRFCYAPDSRDKKNFKCDECRKGYQANCCFCKSKNGILKNVGQKMWAHVFCALSSPKIKVQSYKSLEFRFMKDYKEQSEQKRCYICKNKSNDAFKCWDPTCNNHLHVGCILGYKFLNKQQCYLTFGLLDKHNNTFKHHLNDHREKFQSFRYMKQKRLRPVVCVSHNDDPSFIFCTCSRSKFAKGNKEEVMQVSCRVCKRWFHASCTKISNPQKDEFDCSGCKENNLFKKGVHLPEIIQRMGQIQSSGKIDKEVIKFLDSCILNFSVLLIQFCLQKKNVEEINKYFYRRVLQRIYSHQKYKINSISTKEPRVLEILHLLIKKEYRNYDNIQQKDIVQMIQVMNNQKSYFGLEIDIFAMYHKFLQDKLSTLHKNQNQMEVQEIENNSQEDQIIEVLTKYQHNLIENKHEDLENIVRQTKQTINLLERSKLAKNAYKHFINQNTIFEIFFLSNMKLQHYRATINKLIKIQHLSREQYITQKQYVDIMSFKAPQFQGLVYQKKVQLSSFYFHKLKNLKVVFDYEYNQIMVNQAFNKIKSGLSPKQICLLRKNIVENHMYMQADSQLCLTDCTQIHYEIKKRKLLRNIITPVREQIQQVMEEIKNYLSNPHHPYNFTRQEKEQIDKFFSRSRFYLKIVNQQAKFRGMQHFESEENQHELQFEKICALGGLQSLQSLAFDAMRNWDDSKASLSIGFKTLSELCQTDIQFSTVQKQLISRFAKRIIETLSLYEPQLRISGAIQPTILLKIVKVIRYFHLQQHFRQFIEYEAYYNNWAKDFQKFDNIEKVLQKGDLLNELINLINNKIIAATHTRLNLTVQLRKLKIIRVWAVFSRRVLVQGKGIKISLPSIQELKTVLERCKYPKNQVRVTIQRLYFQAKSIEQKLKLYKTKTASDQQLYEELPIIKNKQLIQEAQKLIQQMKNSQLELICQISELQQLIQQYKQTVPHNLRQWTDLQTQNVSMQNLRKFILQTPFSIKNIDDYVYLYRKMHEIKCKELKDATSKKEFYRLLHYGGTASLMALQKMPKLLTTYKLIDNAKKQIVQSKPKPQRLLPTDIQSIRADLTVDKFEQNCMQACYENARILKQRLVHLRKTRAGWQRYVELMGDITRQPVCLTKLGLQIVDLKKQLDECLNEMESISHLGDYNNSRCDSLILKYKSLGIKNHKMEQFQTLVMRFRSIVDLSSYISRTTYQKFNKMCEQFQQISKLPAIRQIRENCFYKIFQAYTQQRQPSFEIGQTLIRQGSQLLKKATNPQLLLQKLNSITKRLYPEYNKDEEMRQDYPMVASQANSEFQRQEQSENRSFLKLDDEQQHSDRLSRIPKISRSRSESQSNMQYDY